MSNPGRRAWVALAAALLVGPLGCAHRSTWGGLSDLPAASGPLVGEPVPVFQGATVNGRGAFSSKSGRRALVVYFFDSASARSRRPLRALQELALSCADEVVVVGISRDKEAAAARSLASEYDLTFPVLHDGDGALARTFNVSQATAVFVVNGYHQVEWSVQGEQPPDVIGRAAAAVIHGSSRTVATK